MFRSLAAGTLMLASPSSAQAQEILLTGPLAGAPAPIGPTTWRASRVELAATPGVSFGANDEIALLVGGEAHYFAWDRLGAGVWGTGAFAVGSGERALRAAVAPELVLVPITGKANAFEHAYFRFDLHLVGGPALVMSERTGDERSLVPMAGIGFRGFSATFFSNSLDYRLVFGEPLRHLVTLSWSLWLPPLR